MASRCWKPAKKFEMSGEGASSAAARKIPRISKRPGARTHEGGVDKKKILEYAIVERRLLIIHSGFRYCHWHELRYLAHAANNVCVRNISDKARFFFFRPLSHLMIQP